MSGAGETVIHAVGDVFVNRPRPDEVFSSVRGVLDAADVVFGNCEAPFSRTGAETRDTTLVADAKSAVGLKSAGFTVMSCANNHVTDYGGDGLFTTLDVLHRQGIVTAGAGANLEEARRPGIVRTSGGVTAALLAYACYFPLGSEATPERAGIVPVGGENIDPGPNPMCSPGVAPLVRSRPNRAEVQAMTDDIAAAKRTADVVIASFHWGDATRPSVLTDHERRTARTAVDAGADAVFGHHHHVLRGIEIYRGKPIFYGLGNFVWDAPEGWAEMFSPRTKERMAALGKYSIKPRPGYPRLPFHPDGRMTMISRCRFGGDEVPWFGFVPCRIDPTGRVVPLDVACEEGKRVVTFVEEACYDADLPVVLTPDPHERIGLFTGVKVSVPT